MLVICYIDGTEQKYAKLNPPVMDTKAVLDDWRRQNPTAQITHVFESKYDSLRQDVVNLNHFNNNCARYGIDACDYGARVKDGNGRILELTTIDSRKTKYKVFWRNISTNAYIRSTVPHAKHLLEKCRV